MRKMEILGVRVELPHTAPMLLLREADGGRYLPIWMGAAEASGIADQLDGVQPPRPFSHDLMADVVRSLGQSVSAAEITELADGTFYARLVIGEQELDARPSDAIALALRFGAPVLCAEEVLDEAGVELAGAENQERAVAEFREFLDSVDADDFGA